jgi:hypothetical protein
MLLGGSPVNGHEFSDYIVIGDADARVLPPVADILGWRAKQGEMVYSIAAADLCMSFNHHMRANFRIRTNGDMLTDNAIRAYGNPSTQLRAGTDNRCGVNLHFI